LSLSGTLRRTLGTVRKELRSLRVVTVAEGPAAGLRIGLRHASADYGRVTNELPVQSAFADVIRPGQTVYDIGSNVGFFALLAARLVGEGGAVHAFEAAPECSRALERNVRRNGFGNVTVHPFAVSDRSGEVELMQGRHPGGATIAESDRPRDHRRSIVVRSVTIDELVAGGTAPPDFVKIDVEGAEASVLAGMTTTISERPPVVLCELDDPTEKGIAVKVERVRAILDEHGYGIEELDPSYAGSRSRVVHLLARPGSA
jgi:FkbM family methyltransferase